jgi:tRNA pseudouridine38-40 synthase
MEAHPEYTYNYRLIVEYDGACFHGWQKQQGLLTVQSELERAIHIALHTSDISPLQGAGRTDSGVHALGQVVNFRTNFEVDLRVLKHAVSNILKNKLAIVHADKVPMDFNALHKATSRTYRYLILNRAAPTVIENGKAWHVVFPLDIDKLQNDAKILVGNGIDCTSFRASGCLSKSPIKNIFESKIEFDGRCIQYTITGKGFLKQMVRNIVGTLVALNRNKLSVPTMKEVIEAKDRKIAGPTAPAHGLYLVSVQY